MLSRRETFSLMTEGRRDYLSEMRAVCEAEMQPGDAPPIVAQRIVAKLRATDQDLLSGFLDINAENTVRNMLHSMIGSARSRARHVGRAESFRERAIDGADPVGWLSDNVLYPIDESGAQSPLRLMTAAQLQYAAEIRSGQARALEFEATFLRVLAKKVPSGKVVGDVFDEETIFRLRQSITKQSA